MPPQSTYHNQTNKFLRLTSWRHASTSQSDWAPLKALGVRHSTRWRRSFANYPPLRWQKRKQWNSCFTYIHMYINSRLFQAETTEGHLLRSSHTPLASFTFIHLIIHARRLRVLRTWPFWRTSPIRSIYVLLGRPLPVLPLTSAL